MIRTQNWSLRLPARPLRFPVVARFLLVLAMFFGVVAIAGSLSLAQEAPSPKQATESTTDARPADSPGEQLAQESREAAGEEKGENDELKKSPSVSLVAKLTGMSLQHAYWLCVLLNFAVIAGVIIWISRSKLPGVFRSRTESIQKAMMEARKASEEANRRLTEIETRLARLESEIAGMYAAAEKETAVEEARIRAAAEEDIRKIINGAEQEIAAAAKAARRDLKIFAVDLSVDLAQRSIRVDSATDQALVRNFAAELGDEKNGSGKDGH